MSLIVHIMRLWTQGLINIRQTSRRRAQPVYLKASFEAKLSQVETI